MICGKALEDYQSTSSRLCRLDKRKGFAFPLSLKIFSRLCLTSLAALPLRCTERLCLSVRLRNTPRGSASVLTQGAAFRRLRVAAPVSRRLTAHHGGGAAQKRGSEINNRLSAHHGSGGAKKRAQESTTASLHITAAKPLTNGVKMKRFNAYLDQHA